MSTTQDAAEAPERAQPRRIRLGLAALLAAGAIAGAVGWATRPPTLSRVGTLGDGSSGFILALAFSPDGRTLATGGERLLLWHLDGGRPRALELGPESQSEPDGEVEPVDANLSLSEEDPPPTPVGDGAMRALALDFAPDGRTLAAGDHHGVVRLWEVATGRPLAVFRGHAGRVMALEFSPDGSELASAAADRAVRIWDVAGRRERLALPTPRGGGAYPARPIGHAIGYRTNGRTLASADLWGTTALSIWDLETGEGRVVRDGLDALWPFRFDRDGRLLLAADPEAVALWDMETGRRRVVLAGPEPDAWGGLGGEFSPDGRLVAVPWVAPGGSWLGRRSRIVREGLGLIGVSSGHRCDLAIHDATTGRLLAQLAGQRHAAFSPDGRTLATTDGRGSIRLWDAARLTGPTIR